MPKRVFKGGLWAGGACDFEAVTELDVFVDIALQVLRVVHLLANAEEALDSPLRPIRERIKLSKHELVQAYKKHCSDEEWTQADDDEERD